MAELDAPWALRELRAALEVLAAPAEDQSQYLERIGFAGMRPWNVDELALQFDDMYILADQLADDGWLTPSHLSVLRELDETLKRMSGPERPSLWLEDALRDAPEWAEVRILAQAALKLLDEER